MDRPERSTYTADDFLSWRETQTLVLTPKFQRRNVWTNSARSYLIDTLLRGLPVPPIYLRVTQDPDRKKAVREVVDGQQRINALLWFIDGKYALSRTLGGPWAGKTYEALSRDLQDRIREYGFICEVLHGVSDTEVLEVFARLNTYSVKLNAQELRNGKYFGLFKQSAYGLAFQNVEFWRRNRIFSEADIARMLEVELTSELMIAQLDGLQDKKASVNRFYAHRDDKFAERSTVESRFHGTIDEISESLGDSLGSSTFRRVPLFYTLFTVVYHRRYGLPGIERPSPRKILNAGERLALRAAVDNLDAAVRLDVEERDSISIELAQFVEASLRQTDNLGPRRFRFDTLYKSAF
jgi:hypothetical protein